MRGAHPATIKGDRVDGIIPAYAGSTRQALHLPIRRRDHPRVCGEHPTLCTPLRAMRGSSPRMRGAQPQDSTFEVENGIIPAYAGSTVA